MGHSVNYDVVKQVKQVMQGSYSITVQWIKYQSLPLWPWSSIFTVWLIRWLWRMNEYLNRISRREISNFHHNSDVRVFLNKKYRLYFSIWRSKENKYYIDHSKKTDGTCRSDGTKLGNIQKGHTLGKMLKCNKS